MQAGCCKTFEFERFFALEAVPDIVKIFLDFQGDLACVFLLFFGKKRASVQYFFACFRTGSIQAFGCSVFIGGTPQLSTRSETAFRSSQKA